VTGREVAGDVASVFAEKVTSLEIVRCFSELACGLATGTTLILGGALVGLGASACVLTAGIGCVIVASALGGALSGAASGAVMHSTLYKTSDGLVCASIVGAATGAASNGLGGALDKSGAGTQVLQFASSNKAVAMAAKKAAGKSAGSIVPGC
jgi:hypothetical protein